MILGKFSNLFDLFPNSIYILDQSGNNRIDIGYTAVIGNIGWNPTSTYGSIYVYIDNAAFVSIKKNVYHGFEK